MSATLILKDAYGAQIPLDLAALDDGRLVLGVAVPALGEEAPEPFTGTLTYTDEYGVDTEIALARLADGRFVPVVAVAGGTGTGTGAAGKSAYELAVENGFVGTVVEWLDSLVGPQGPSGSSEDPGDLVNAFNANLV